MADLKELYRNRHQSRKLEKELLNLKEQTGEEASYRKAGLIRNIVELGEIISAAGCQLSGAPLSDAKLFGADLHNANLSNADLTGADLRLANFCHANLSGANLTGADLSGATLAGADLRDANLNKIDLSSASGNDKTLLSEGIERPSRWTSKKDD